MKIEIELMDNNTNRLEQMKAVDIYITKNTVKTDAYNYFGEPVKRGDLTLFERITIKQTSKVGKFETGEKISTSNFRFHVSCRMTKSGVYKFKVWGAV